MKPMLLHDYHDLSAAETEPLYRRTTAIRLISPFPSLPRWAMNYSRVARS
jgi:hypothetical protein